ncbi:MAG: hypothetical protein QW328_06935 [Nitrososphaerota archaeon]
MHDCIVLLLLVERFENEEFEILPTELELAREYWELVHGVPRVPIVIAAKPVTMLVFVPGSLLSNHHLFGLVAAISVASAKEVLKSFSNASRCIALNRA